MISSAVAISSRRASDGRATSASLVGKSRKVTSGAQSQGGVERRAERGLHDSGEASGAICREVHRLRRTWSESRHLTSEADILDKRLMRHSRSTEFIGLSLSTLEVNPNRHTSVVVQPVPAVAAARVARVVVASDSNEMGIGPPLRTASTNSWIWAD
jgi:hypothetical protein